MHRYFNIVLLLLLGQVIAWADEVVIFSGRGEGTTDNPYLISSESELRSFAEVVTSSEENRGKCAKLENDITCTSPDWTPIAYTNRNYPYTGTFDGQGYTISGITASQSSSHPEDDGGVGLFGTLGEGGVIKNVFLRNCSFVGNTPTGAICGIVKGGTILSCAVYWDVTVRTYPLEQPTQPAGGICGSAAAPGGIISCFCNAATITGTPAALIVGTSNNASVSHCFTYQNGAWYNGNIIQASGDDSGNNYTEDNFKSGEIAYRLNKNLGKDEWHWTQKIGTDSYPVFRSDSVYMFGEANQDIATLKSGEYLTRWYPVNFTITNAKAYTVESKNSDTSLKLKEFTTKDNANIPLLIYNNSKEEGSVVLPAYTIYSNAKDYLKTLKTSEGNLLVGNYNGYSNENTLSEPNYYYFLETHNGVQAFYILKVGERWQTVKNYRCFLQIPKNSSNDAKEMLNFCFEDTPTAIDSVPLTATADGNGEAYNILGQRVASASQNKGILIVNHKKVLMK